LRAEVEELGADGIAGRKGGDGAVEGLEGGEVIVVARQ
jgi:hypothetical protein